MLCLVSSGEDTRSDICPGAVVEGFLLQKHRYIRFSIRETDGTSYLSPNQFSVGVLVEMGGDLYRVSISAMRASEFYTYQVVGEWRKLFNT